MCVTSNPLMLRVIRSAGPLPMLEQGLGAWNWRCSSRAFPCSGKLAQVVHEESFAPGTVIIRENDYGDCIYLVIEGVARVVSSGRLLAESGAHTFFGELALLGSGTRTASVVAKEYVRALRLHRKELFRMMDRYPRIAIEICRRALDERLQS